NLDADFQLPQHPIAVAAISRKDEWQRLRQMGRDVVNNFLFHTCLVNQSYAPLGQVAQPAVKQPAGTAARAERQVVLLDQADPQSTHRRVASDARANDAAANDQEVEGGGGERGDGFGTTI